MAIVKGNLGEVNATIKVVARIDGAIDNSNENVDALYNEYIVSLDETILPIIAGEEPTRFVLRKSLPLSAHEAIMQKQMSIGQDMKPVIHISYMLEEVRCALVDIINPSNLPAEQQLKFKRDSDGFADKDLISSLHECGVLNNLFTARQAANQKNGLQSVNKKK